MSKRILKTGIGIDGDEKRLEIGLRLGIDVI